MTGMRRRIRTTVGAVAMVAALALGLVVLQPSAAHAAESDTIYSLVNDARWSQGSAGLARNAAMDAVAEGWAAELARAGTLSHNPQYPNQIPGGWVAAAENVAQGYQGGTAMHEGWMNSAGHRANILGNFTDIGIAYLEAGGTTWGVEVFANYPGSTVPQAPAAEAPAPEAPAPAPAPAPAAEAPASVPVAEAAAPAATSDASASETPPTPKPSNRGKAGDPAATAAERRASDAARLENDRPVSALLGRNDATGPTSPPWAVALGALIVLGVALRTSLHRVMAARRSHHPG